MDGFASFSVVFDVDEDRAEVATVELTAEVLFDFFVAAAEEEAEEEEEEEERFVIVWVIRSAVKKEQNDSIIEK